LTPQLGTVEKGNVGKECVMPNTRKKVDELRASILADVIKREYLEELLENAKEVWKNAKSRVK
jgi:hypothetical protein